MTAIRLILYFLIGIAVQTTEGLSAEELVVYSERKEHLIKPVFDAYAAETGVNVKFVTDKAGALIERLKAEEKSTPADLLITVDAGNLWRAAEDGLLLPVDSDVLKRNIPENLRDPGDQWFGLSVRARTIVYNTERISPSDLSTYEDLGRPKWKGRLCLRTSKKVYNQSLVAMMIHQLGAEETETIVRGWVANLAADVFSSDTAMMEAIAAGQCDAGIGNTYYFGRLIRDNPDIPLSLYWPDQGGAGVHVNISGAGVTRFAHHPEMARAFLEWLSAENAQRMFADANMEYPANANVKPDPLVASWGSFKSNPLNVSKAGELQREAVLLMDRAGYK